MIVHSAISAGRSLSPSTRKELDRELRLSATNRGCTSSHRVAGLDWSLTVGSNQLTIPVLILFVALVVTGCGGRSPAAPRHRQLHRRAQRAPSPSSTQLQPLHHRQSLPTREGNRDGQRSPISGATSRWKERWLPVTGRQLPVDFDTAPAFPVRIKIDAAGMSYAKRHFGRAIRRLIALAPPSP